MNEKPSNLHFIHGEIEKLELDTPPNSFDGGGGGGYDSLMEERVKRLEADVSAIKVDLATITSNYATKADIGELRADMHKMNAEIKTWTLATMITIIGTMLAAIFGVATIFNNASKSSTPVQPPAPIIYTLPAGSTVLSAPQAPAAAATPPAKQSN